MPPRSMLVPPTPLPLLSGVDPTAQRQLTALLAQARSSVLTPAQIMQAGLFPSVDDFDDGGEQLPVASSANGAQPSSSSLAASTSASASSSSSFSPSSSVRLEKRLPTLLAQQREEVHHPGTGPHTLHAMASPALPMSPPAARQPQQQQQPISPSPMNGAAALPTSPASLLSNRARSRALEDGTGASVSIESSPRSVPAAAPMSMGSTSDTILTQAFPSLEALSLFEHVTDSPPLPSAATVAAATDARAPSSSTASSSGSSSSSYGPSNSVPRSSASATESFSAPGANSGPVTTLTKILIAQPQVQSHSQHPVPCIHHSSLEQRVAELQLAHRQAEEQHARALALQASKHEHALVALQGAHEVEQHELLQRVADLEAALKEEQQSRRAERERMSSRDAQQRQRHEELIAADQEREKFVTELRAREQILAQREADVKDMAASIATATAKQMQEREMHWQAQVDEARNRSSRLATDRNLAGRPAAEGSGDCCLLLRDRATPFALVDCPFGYSAVPACLTRSLARFSARFPSRVSAGLAVSHPPACFLSFVVVPRDWPIA
jgi:hypothetical protein